MLYIKYRAYLKMPVGKRDLVSAAVTRYTITATTGTGADAQTPNAAEYALARADLAGLKANQDAIITALEKMGLVD